MPNKKQPLDFYLVLIIEAYIMSLKMNFKGELALIHSVIKKKLLGVEKLVL